MREVFTTALKALKPEAGNLFGKTTQKPHPPEPFAGDLRREKESVGLETHPDTPFAVEAKPFEIRWGQNQASHRCLFPDTAAYLYLWFVGGDRKPQMRTKEEENQTEGEDQGTELDHRQKTERKTGKEEIEGQQTQDHIGTEEIEVEGHWQGIDLGKEDPSKHQKEKTERNPAHKLRREILPLEKRKPEDQEQEKQKREKLKGAGVGKQKMMGDPKTNHLKEFPAPGRIKPGIGPMTSEKMKPQKIEGKDQGKGTTERKKALSF